MAKKHITLSIEEATWRAFKARCALLGLVPSVELEKIMLSLCNNGDSSA